MSDLSARDHIVSLDKRYVWHPYTAMSEYVAEVEPPVIARASGVRLYDVNGQSYIDGNASWWCATLGHAHPRIVAAIKRQAELLCHTALAGMTHEPAARLAERLVSVAPAGLEHVFFSDNGSTAIEAALKLALQYWHQNGRPQRRRFVALDGAFHGETLGATAIGGVELFRRPFASVTMDCVHVPPGLDGHERAFADLERVLDTGADEIAAVVLEPIVQGAAGMRMYDPAYLRAARELTTRHDVLLVLDEVFTGYGRTGPMWASEHAGIVPDIQCVAKGFTAGTLPMAATLVTSRLYEGFLGGIERAFLYGHTFCGHALGASVALEVFEIYRQEEVLEQIPQKAARIATAFEKFRAIPGVATTRSLGMIGALELAGGEGYAALSGRAVYREALKRGAYLRSLGNVIYITPALNIPDADLETLLAIVEESVRSALKT
jgi:adenosylmethionine-8-amino-7-oxononanoate aminotransferase